MASNSFDRLWSAAITKNIEVVLPAYGHGNSRYLRIECRTADDDRKVIDVEKVKRNETTEQAAERLWKRLRKDRVIDS